MTALPLPPEQRIEHEGRTLRVIPIQAHDEQCRVRVATPQGTTPEVLHCAGCGFCYQHPGQPAASLPEPTVGHLPIAATPTPAAGQTAAADVCRCHPGEQHWCSKRPTPTLAERVAEAERLANELITMLAGQYDPDAAPANMWVHSCVSMADVHLGNAVSDVRRALAHLRRLAELCATEVPA